MQPGDRDQVDVDVISKLLSMVMAVRWDRIFRSIYGQCHAIFMTYESNQPQGRSCWILDLTYFSVCAKVCHRGHRVVYSWSICFFYDCGAGGVRGSNCQCLKPNGTSSVRPPAACSFHETSLSILTEFWK
jgi:hypothetical protein